MSVLDQLRQLLERVDVHTRPVGSSEIEWSVLHRDDAGSLLVRFEPWHPPADRDVVSLHATTVAVVDGIAALGEKPSIPAFYNEGAVRNVGRAGARREREGIELVAVSAVNGSTHSEV